MRLSLLQFLISLIAIFAPLLYLVGLSFYNGYTSTYGISSDIFEMSVQDVYYVGYVAIFTSLFDLSEFLSGYFLSLKGIVFILSFFTLLCIMAITIRFFSTKKTEKFSSTFSFFTKSDVGQVISFSR